MHYEPLTDEDNAVPTLSYYTSAEIQRMKEELKNNAAKIRLLRFELERKRRFRDVEEAQHRRRLDALQKEVQNLELIRANMETKANDKRRDEEMKQIGELLIGLTEAERELEDAKKLTSKDTAELKRQAKAMREVEKEFRHAPDDIHTVAHKKKQNIESRLFAVQRKHNHLRHKAEAAKDTVYNGMAERQAFKEAYTRVERQYNQNAKALNVLLEKIGKLNEERAEYLKRALKNRGRSNESKEEVIMRLRHAEKMANVERDTRLLSVCRAIDRTPYWKSASLSKAIKSYYEKREPTALTMENALKIESTLASIRELMGAATVDEAIRAYKERQDNNQLLAVKLKDLNDEAERLVEQIETKYRELDSMDQEADMYEQKMEKQTALLIERTAVVQQQMEGCQNRLDSFREFYNEQGGHITELHDLMWELIPHPDSLKRPDKPCTGDNYSDYQISIARLIFYFHAIFDYWKQQEHERMSRTDPMYTGTDDEDHPLAMREAKLPKVHYPVATKVQLLPPDLRAYEGRHQFENEDGTEAVMSSKSMECFADVQAEILAKLQEDYLIALDKAEEEEEAVFTASRASSRPASSQPASITLNPVSIGGRSRASSRGEETDVEELAERTLDEILDHSEQFESEQTEN